MTRALMLVAALLSVGVAGCHEGNTLENSGPTSAGGGGGGNGRIDMAGPNNSPADLAHVTVVGDMAAETCGSIVACAVSCLGSSTGGTGGLGGLAGCTSCFTGAPADATAQAQAIFTCAITNCLSSITGGGGTAGIFQCLATSCTSELAMCQGLGLGGF